MAPSWVTDGVGEMSEGSGVSEVSDVTSVGCVQSFVRWREAQKYERKISPHTGTQTKYEW